MNFTSMLRFSGRRRACTLLSRYLGVRESTGARDLAASVEILDTRSIMAVSSGVLLWYDRCCLSSSKMSSSNSS